MIDLTKPLQTRSGDPVEVITVEGRGPYPIVGYISDSAVDLACWRSDGSYSCDRTKHPFDLINTPVQREGWVLVKSGFLGYRSIDAHSRIYPSWELAVTAAATSGRSTHWIPAKITWEE